MVYCQFGFSLISPSLLYVMGALHVMIGFGSVFGNLPVLIILFKVRSLRTRSHTILGSLAITDLLTGLTTEPMILTQLFSTTAFNDCTLNSIRRIFNGYLSYVSFALIALISYDRYLHLSKTVNYTSYMTFRKIKVLIFLAWAIPVIFPLINNLSPKNRNAYMISVSLWSFLNFVAVVTSYITIIRMVQRKQRESFRCNQESRSASNTRWHLRSAKTATIILICFAVTTLPWACFTCVTAIGGLYSKQVSFMKPRESGIFYSFAVLSLTANSMINPIIYYVKIPEIRARLINFARGDRINSTISANVAVVNNCKAAV